MLKTLELCSCVPYYFPNQEALPVCNFTKIPCLVDNYCITVIIILKFPLLKFCLLHFTVKLHESRLNESLVCDCPANCNGMFYDVLLNVLPLVLHNFSIDPF